MTDGGRSVKPFHEGERRGGDLAPAAVDRQRVSAVRDLQDLRHGGVAFLAPERGIRDRPRHRIVLLAGDDQQGAAFRRRRIDLRFRPRVEVGRRGLEERCA